jgi:hypothetical protein
MPDQTSTATTLKPNSQVRVEVTEYNPNTGMASRKLLSLNFDKTSVMQFSTPIVIKMNVKGVQKIDNIKIGIMKSSIDVESEGEARLDGSKPTGNVGVEHSPSLSEKSSLSSYFGGINETGSPSDVNNVAISNSTDTESEYIYLSVKMPDVSSRGYIGIKWFFDFI